MAVLFALCLLSPVAAFAFSDTPAHCLTVTEAPQVKSGSHGRQHDGAGHAEHAAMPHAIASGYDVAARCQRDILPLRKIISDELMLRSGAMQVDVFVLPAEARQKIADTVTVK